VQTEYSEYTNDYHNFRLNQDCAQVNHSGNTDIDYWYKL